MKFEIISGINLDIFPTSLTIFQVLYLSHLKG